MKCPFNEGKRFLDIDFIKDYDKETNDCFYVNFLEEIGSVSTKSFIYRDVCPLCLMVKLLKYLREKDE